MNGRMYRSVSAAFIAMMIIALSGCGGSSGSGDASAAGSATVSTGQFSGIKISGLFYETESLSGLTDKEGCFRYRSGEAISFRLGQTQLGGTEAKAEITPAELVSFEPVTDEAILIQLLSNPMVNSIDMLLNINTLLMSLDKDGNPENGIDLGDAHALMEERAEELEISFKARAFSESANLHELVKRLRARNAKSLEFVASNLYQALGLSITAKRTFDSHEENNGHREGTASVHYNHAGLIEAETFLLDEYEQQEMKVQYQYDAENRVTKVSNSYTGDSKSYRYTQGRISEIRIESNDSKSVYQENRRYDNQGNLARLETDQDGDGQVDRMLVFERSENQERVSESRSENGLTIDSHKVTEFQDQQVTAIREDYDSDGQTDLEMRYTYDAQDRLASREIISRDPSIESGKSYFEYDDQDRLIRYSSDNDQDGHIDYIEVYAYDYQDNHILFRRDQEADGVWNYSAFYRYDEQGNRIEMTEDTDGNGIVDHHWQATLQQIEVESDWATLLARL